MIINVEIGFVARFEEPEGEESAEAFVYAQSALRAFLERIRGDSMAVVVEVSPSDSHPTAYVFRGNPREGSFDYIAEIATGFGAKVVL